MTQPKPSGGSAKPDDWRERLKQHLDKTAPPRPTSDALPMVPVIRETTEEEISEFIDELNAIRKPAH